MLVIRGLVVEPQQVEYNDEVGLEHAPETVRRREASGGEVQQLREQETEEDEEDVLCWITFALFSALYAMR
jgi:hypothetical protein